MKVQTHLEDLAHSSNQFESRGKCRALVGNNPKKCDQCLPQQEFAFYNKPNRFTRYALFTAAYGHQPKHLTFLQYQPAVENLFQHNQELYKSVQQALQKSNVKSKAHVDRTRRVQNFELGGMVMVQISKDRYPAASYSKLKARNYGPCEIMRKLNSNQGFSCIAYASHRRPCDSWVRQNQVGST